jgi:hypothetical protein
LDENKFFKIYFLPMAIGTDENLLSRVRREWKRGENEKPKT